VIRPSSSPVPRQIKSQRSKDNGVGRSYRMYGRMIKPCSVNPVDCCNDGNELKTLAGQCQ
jgi:hypothetical protein